MFSASKIDQDWNKQKTLVQQMKTQFQFHGDLSTVGHYIRLQQQQLNILFLFNTVSGQNN